MPTSTPLTENALLETTKNAEMKAKQKRLLHSFVHTMTSLSEESESLYKALSPFPARDTV